MTLIELFTQIANAIREKKGTTEAIPATSFAEEITSIQTGGGGGASGSSVYDLVLDGSYTIMPSYQCDQILNGAYVVINE